MKPNLSESLKIYKQDTWTLDDHLDDLYEITKVKKCSLCGCNSDTMEELGKIAIDKQRNDIAEKVSTLRSSIIDKKKYDCIGCNPCYPADISNALFSLSGGAEKKSCCSGPCSSSSDSTSWPIDQGDYIVGDETNCIAICTLANRDLVKTIYTDLEEHVALVGKCDTENIGIEKVVRNCVSNSNITTLILCGEDSVVSKSIGHYAGQSLVSLHKNGVDDGKKIIGSLGKRPYLYNLSDQEIATFRQEINVVNLVNTTDLDEIRTAVFIAKEQATARKNVVKEKRDYLNASLPDKLTLDKQGYFIVIPQYDSKEIFVEYYNNKGVLLDTIRSNDGPALYHTIISQGYVSRLDHAAYLGREITRAEMALSRGEVYIQDKAQGEL